MSTASGRSSSSPSSWARVLPFGLVLVAAAVVLANCADHSGGAGSAGPVSRSSTIAHGLGGDSVWLTSPDDDAVVEVDARTLAVRHRVAVPGSPRELTRLNGRLLVTAAQSDSLTVVDLRRTPARVGRVALPCGGSHSVAAVADARSPFRADVGFVTCATDDLVTVVDVTHGRPVATLAVPDRPTGVVLADGSLTVSSATGAALRTWSLRAIAADLERAEGVEGAAGQVVRLGTRPSVRRVPRDAGRSTSMLGPLDAGDHGVVGTYQSVDNLRPPTTAELAAGTAGYGTPLRGRARIDPSLVGPCGSRFADFRTPGRTLSGPVALASSADGDLVWVVGQFSHSVSVLRCDPTAKVATSRVLATFRVGAGARGIVLSPDARTAFVDVGYDHAVARLALPSSVRANDAGGGPIPVRAPTAVVRRPVTDRHLSALAEEGRRMFADATDTHLTPSGVVTCASCHLDGGDDGLTWRIHTSAIPEKLRRTPAVWALDPKTKPLHWDGSFGSADDLTAQTVHELLGGDGLLVDAGAVTAYLHELQPPPGRPARTAADRAAVARGSKLFASNEVGCATCHLGARKTDRARHDALARATDPAAVLRRVATPPLPGVRGRAPYGHDGRAPDLAVLLTLPGDRHGHAAHLTKRELADLIAYLDSL